MISGGVAIVFASYNYILQPMLDTFGATASENALVRQLPSIASLLVVFLGGVIGDRFGHRKILLYCGILFTLGSTLVAVAPVFQFVTLGLVIQGVGTGAGGVIALGFLAAQIKEPANRASAFSVFAIVSPLIYLIVPFVAGVLVAQLSWRYVAALWVFSGLAMIWGILRLLPGETNVPGEGELLTPLVAGLVLVGAVQTVDSAAGNGLTSADTLIRFGICVAALLVLVLLYRRPGPKSLSLAALRRGGMLVLLAVVLLVPFTNIWYYATVGFQYVYGLSVVQTAAAMAPVQLAGVAGAIVTRKILQKKGIAFTGTLMLLLFAASMLSLLLIQADSPLWVPVLAFGAYGLTLTAAGVPITNAVMNSAEHGEEGSASAFRSASGKVGQSLGVIFTTAIMTTVATTSVTAAAQEQGMQSQQSAQIIDGIISGATSENLSSEYSVPVDQVDTLDQELIEGMVDGLHAVAVGGAAVSLACAAFFNVGLRRQARYKERTAEVERSAA